MMMISRKIHIQKTKCHGIWSEMSEMSWGFSRQTMPLVMTGTVRHGIDGP